MLPFFFTFFALYAHASKEEGLYYEESELMSSPETLFGLRMEHLLQLNHQKGLV